MRAVHLQEPSQAGFHSAGHCPAPSFFSLMRFIVPACVALAALFAAPAASAARPDNSALDTKVIQWAQANIGPYNTAINYAKHGKPATPVPPMVDPPCHACGTTAPTQGEQQVAAWVTKNLDPETTYLKTLFGIQKQLALLGGSNSNILSPAAQKALNQFSDSDAEDAVNRLAEDLKEKANNMAQQYDREPKQAYAGITFLLAAYKAAVLSAGGASNSDDAAIQYANTWEQSIADGIDKDIFDGHKYNLCPVYAEIFRTVELLGGPATNMDSYQQSIQKMDKFLNFNVTMNLHAVGTDTKGFKAMDLSWQIKGKLHLDIDWTNGCYTPKWANNNSFAVTVQNWNISAPDGTQASLTSSRSFNIKASDPYLNLCDPNPVLKVPFNYQAFPKETIQVKGVSKDTQMLAGMLGVVANSNSLTISQVQALTGNTDNGTSSSNSNAMNQAAASLKAHSGDLSWLMGPQGQAAIAAMQKQAMSQVSIPAANASSPAEMMATLQSALLPWTNGSSQPVSKTLKFKKDDQGSLDITLVTTVQQQQQ